MAIFQPRSIKVRDQQTIQLLFSSPPSLFLTKANFAITSTFTGVVDLDILDIKIEDTIITLVTRPMFPDNLYLIQLLDIPTQVFEDINNIILSDLTDDRNIYFVGVQDVNNVRDTMLQNLPSNYDVSEQTLVRDVTATTANELNIASVILQEIKNDNFISVPVVDELYFRGTGPTDRLKNEGTYLVSRVAKTITGTNAAGSKFYDPVANPNIPFEILNLRVMQVIETVPNGTSTNKFDGFLITVSHQYVTKLISVNLQPNDVDYDPTQYGYALLNNNYDRFARPSPILSNNQILLSPLTNGAFPEPIPGDTLIVTYEFDNVGRRVDRSSVSLYTILKQVNEVVPSSVTNFYLEFGNIVDSLGQNIVLGGVEFNVSTINLNQHPAFLKEITYNQDSLPSAPGEYAINYSNGQVFVFGTQNQIGSGLTPPVATYFYKDIAIANTDYFISDDGYNVSLNSFSAFATQPFYISFLYEDVLTPGIDYLVSSHNEVLHERVNNRLISDFGVQVLNSQVKDVYQILNETTGESYTPGLVENNKIFFTGNIPPATSISLGELAQVGLIADEALLVGIPATTPNGLLKVFPINLKEKPILNQRQDGIGSNFNTSLQFTNNDLFVNEYYFNGFDSIVINLNKLRNIGDYLVDYLNGIIYLAVSNIQNFDVGHASYAYGSFIPTYKHVLGVTSIGLGTTASSLKQDFALGFYEDGLIVPSKLNYGYDAFDGTTRVPNSNFIFVGQLQDDFTVYTQYPIKKVYAVYTQNDADGYSSSQLISKNLFDSAVNSFTNTLIDLKTYVVLPVEADSLTYYKVIIPDETHVVKSIVTVDTGIELLDTDLDIIKYKNIIIKSVVPSPLINPTSATVTMQNIVTLSVPTLDSLVDIAGRRFDIISINLAGNILTVNVSDFIPPVVNAGSQILDHNGILIADHLNIISVTKLPDLLYILHYDVFPNGILAGYQVKDYNGNTFYITDVQTASVVVSVPNPNILPIIDPTARIETQAFLQAPSGGTTTLFLPIDSPVAIGTNVKIGYVPDTVNASILAANTSVLSAGGAGLIIDYSIGQYFIDYRHLDDELLVSYDWGDNQLDWSISDTLKAGDPYYVSYLYGASRDGLETNFGPLTNVDFLQNAPLSIGRETYRTAVSAAIKAFLKGPTHEAIRILAHLFTQIDPAIQESILNQWIVGRDPLNLQVPNATGEIVFGNGKYNDGLIFTDNNSIQLPGASSMRLTQGTFSTWFRPNWNGNQADEDIVISLPSALHSVYYNAHNILPQNAPSNPWFLDINSDAYGTAYVNNDYLEVINAKSEFIDGYPNNLSYVMNDSDGYSLSSTLLLHENFTDFAYVRNIGTYIWNRYEPILSPLNDLDINFAGYVKEIIYANPALSLIKVTNVFVDDGYNKYDAGFYLTKKSLYTAEVLLEDIHLSIDPPYPHASPPIIVSTIFGSNVATVIEGDTSTLTLGQQITIGTAYPELTNIIGITPGAIVLRTPALSTLTSENIAPVDPPSDSGTQDGYGEVHLVDKLGTRPLGTTEIRTNGWERQLLIKLHLTLYASGFIMTIGSSDPPLTTQAPVIDFLTTIIPGSDVFIDGYGNVFEVAKVEPPYIWLEKPSASNVNIPLGIITQFRKVVGIDLPDSTFVSTAHNWSKLTNYSMQKRDGELHLYVDDVEVSGSYVLSNVFNTDGDSRIGFGQIDVNIESLTRIESVHYHIHSLYELSDVYIGNTGNNPTNDIITFKYDQATTGIPSIDSDKYFAVFTSTISAVDEEPVDEVFIKMKMPSLWELSDGENVLELAISPTIQFSTNTSGDIIDVIDAYGMVHRQLENNEIILTAIDTSLYTPGQTTILLDGGPELRIAAGKRHYLFDVEAKEGALRLYRNGTGRLVAETQLDNNLVFNIRANIESWSAGQLHHVAMSWKISSPDETDELHLFIDGDEVPNEITFGSDIDGYFGQVYEEPVIPSFRVASSDGYIVNNLNGSGLFIPNTAVTQPDDTWINKTIVLNATMLGPNIYLDEPLIVGAMVDVVGGKMLFLSQNGQQLDFTIYGPSVPVLYGLATSVTAIATILTRVNLGVFKNGIELSGPYSTIPMFRQVGDSQIVELYSINPETGQYVEDVNIGDTITLRTYGLLTQRVRKQVFQYGSLIRSYPVIVDTLQANRLISVNVAINSGGTAFLTSLPPPVDPTQVTATKILLPRTMI